MKRLIMLTDRTANASGHEPQASLIEIPVPVFAIDGFQGTTAKQVPIAATANKALLCTYVPTTRALHNTTVSKKAQRPESREAVNKEEQQHHDQHALTLLASCANPSGARSSEAAS